MLMILIIMIQLMLISVFQASDGHQSERVNESLACINEITLACISSSSILLTYHYDIRTMTL